MKFLTHICSMLGDIKFWKASNQHVDEITCSTVIRNWRLQLSIVELTTEDQTCIWQRMNNLMISELLASRDPTSKALSTHFLLLLLTSFWKTVSFSLPKKKQQRCLLYLCYKETHETKVNCTLTSRVASSINQVKWLLNMSVFFQSRICYYLPPSSLPPSSCKDLAMKMGMTIKHASELRKYPEQINQTCAIDCQPGIRWHWSCIRVDAWDFGVHETKEMA